MAEGVIAVMIILTRGGGAPSQPSVVSIGMDHTLRLDMGCLLADHTEGVGTSALRITIAIVAIRWSGSAGGRCDVGYTVAGSIK